MILPLIAAGLLITTVLPPVRCVDTRNTSDPLQIGTARSYKLRGACGIPSNAAGFVANITVVDQKAPGYLQVYPAGQPTDASTVNFDPPGPALANQVVIGFCPSPVTCQWDITVAVFGSTVHLLIDVLGYLSP